VFYYSLTSGPRIKLRFFAGWDLEIDSLSGNGWLNNAYANGVPMGSNLVASSQLAARRPLSFKPSKIPKERI